jgi:coenzyme F420 hydrogenase subunit beta
MRLNTAADVAAWRLCVGCGACAYICPQQRIQLVDFPEEGIRPVVKPGDCEQCVDCLRVCPACENDHSEMHLRAGIIPELLDGFGPVLELWEGYALDKEVRYRGSSGGVMTALALYCVERERMHGVLQIGPNPADPVRNVTRLSRSRTEMLACTGSRYAPASACDKLHLIERAPAPCVFIGQPAEVTALRKAQELRPKLKENVGLALSFFCAGSPATKGTLDLLAGAGVRPEKTEEIRYRGLGWPGMFAVKYRGDETLNPLMTYQKSWGFLQRYRPFSVHLWPDNSGEDADITCGDPWYRNAREHPEGFSLLAVRTETGRRLLRGAVEAGYLYLEPAAPQKLIESQSGFPGKRGSVWGRLCTMRAFGLPVPKIKGYALFANWLRLPFIDKLKSTVGTARRILRRGYLRPLKLAPGRESSVTSLNTSSGTAKIDAVQ